MTERKARGSGLETAPVFSQRGKRARFVVRSSPPSVEKPCPLTPHTGFSSHCLSPWKKEAVGASLLICGSKAAGVPRGMALLVAGRSPRRGGREQSDRGKGERGAFSPQRAAGGNERADESHTRAFAEFRSAEKNVSGTALRT